MRKKRVSTFMKSKVLYAVEVTPDEHPRVKYFLNANGKSKTAAKASDPLVEVTAKVARLEILPVPDDQDGAHYLRRLDSDGKEVWQTRHPSLKETFWHAEWEYEVEEKEWEEA